MPLKPSRLKATMLKTQTNADSSPKNSEAIYWKKKRQTKLLLKKQKETGVQQCESEN
jgi:hypothetical protein